MNYLYEPFIQAMDDIGRYGFDKYGTEALSFQIANQEDSKRTARTTSGEIIRHAREHGNMYLRAELHDHFGTLGHQLAAAAFNPMMEFYFMRREGKR